MEFHSFAVHYAIAFLSLSSVLWVAYTFRPNPQLWFGFWLMSALGSIAAVFAIISGEFVQVELLQKVPALGGMISNHENCAYGTITLYFFCYFWILFRKKKLSRRENLSIGIILLFACALLLLTAAYGGSVAHSPVLKP